MFSRIKTYAAAFAVLALTVSAAAQTATVTVSTDKKSNTVKVQVAPKTEAKAAVLDKTDKTKKLSYDPKAVLAKDADNGIGIPLASLPRIGKYKKSEIDMTKWQFLPEYEDEVFEWYRLPDGRCAMVSGVFAMPAITAAQIQNALLLKIGKEETERWNFV